MPNDSNHKHAIPPRKRLIRSRLKAKGSMPPYVHTLLNHIPPTGPYFLDLDLGLDLIGPQGLTSFPKS